MGKTVNKFKETLATVLTDFFNDYFSVKTADKKVISLEEEHLHFGDSLIIDEESVKKEGLELFASGLINRYYLLKNYFGYTDEEIKNSNPILVDESELAFGPVGNTEENEEENDL